MSKEQEPKKEIIELHEQAKKEITELLQPFDNHFTLFWDELESGEVYSSEIMDFKSNQFMNILYSMARENEDFRGMLFDIGMKIFEDKKEDIVKKHMEQ